MNLIDFESTQTMQREAAADKLRELADQLSRHNQIAYEDNGLKTTIPVPDQVTLSVEIEVGDSGSELEVEITW